MALTAEQELALLNLLGQQSGQLCSEYAHAGRQGSDPQALRYLGGGRYACPHGKTWLKDGKGGLRAE